METKIETGQVWSIKNDKGKVLIFDLDKKREIVHFAYLKNGEIIIYHIPITYNLFLKSIVKYLGDDEITQDFFDAKKVWEKHSGGVWDIEIKEVIDITLKDFYEN